MALNLIYGRAGSGKSTYLFKKIKEIIKDTKKIYIITPEQFSFTAEKRLLDNTDSGAAINAEVLTFSRMAFRVIAENGNNLRNIEGFGKSMLFYDILDKSKNELQFLGKNLQNVEVVERSITEFKKHNITEEKLLEIINNTEDKYLKSKLLDLSVVYSKFQEAIKDKFLDENDSLFFLAENLKNAEEFKNSVIFIDEFVGFTPQEYKVIEELAKISKDIYITICADNLEVENTDPDTDIFYSSKITANKLIKIAELTNIGKPKKIYLDKGYRFKSKELEFIEKNIYSNTYERFEEEPKDINLFLANNPYSEIEYVASKIVQNVRDNKKCRYKDIGIITKNIDTYSGLIKAIFSKYNIPVYIDEKKDLSQNILIKYILSVLDVFDKNWSYDSVISYIKSKFCDISDMEIYTLENYAKKLGIKYSKWYKEDWKFGEDEETLKKLNDIRKKVINPLLSFKNKCYKNMTGLDLSKRIYEFLIENEIDKKLKNEAEIVSKENADLGLEYEASFNIVVKILDEIAKIFDKDTLTFEKYASFLKIAFSENGMGKLPAGFDEVTARRHR